MSIQRRIVRNRLVGLVAAGLMLTGTLSIVSNDAYALGGNCWAWLDNQVGMTFGAGRCSSLHNDTKARVTLDLAMAPDFHSAWFTQLNKTYWTTPWMAASGIGYPNAARVDQALR